MVFDQTSLLLLNTGWTDPYSSTKICGTIIEPMLDLNYVRENIDKVREALNARRADTKALDDFTRADEERRRVIAESDQLNAQRNASSREIGALMKEGKKQEAEARRAEVGGLK